MSLLVCACGSTMLASDRGPAKSGEDGVNEEELSMTEKDGCGERMYTYAQK